MSTIEYLCRSIGINPHQLSKEENQILEAELFYLLCKELNSIFKTEFELYFRLIKFNPLMEEIMIEENFMRCIVNDLVCSESYTLSGIATYTQTPEDIIQEIAIGKNTNPSLHLARKIIELHRNTRPELYKKILEKFQS